MLNRYTIGVKLMSWGAKMCLNSGEDKEKLKMTVNGNTLLGSHTDSGGHLHSHIQPMCDYDTQSVVNVLKQQLLLSDDNQVKDSSQRKEYYRDEWK